jgi:hypothetical protein
MGVSSDNSIRKSVIVCDRDGDRDLCDEERKNDVGGGRIVVFRGCIVIFGGCIVVFRGCIVV